MFQLFIDADYAATNCGLFIHPVEKHVGATPDALLLPGSLVEVKCPFSYKNNSVLDTCELGSQDLPRKYFWQVQQQLYVTGMAHCILLQYRPFTPANNACLTISCIQFDPALMLPLLYMYKSHAHLLQTGEGETFALTPAEGGDFELLDWGKEKKPPYADTEPVRKKRKKRKRRKRHISEQELHDYMNFL